MIKDQENEKINEYHEKTKKKQNVLNKVTYLAIVVALYFNFECSYA